MAIWSGLGVNVYIPSNSPTSYYTGDQTSMNNLIIPGVIQFPRVRFATDLSSGAGNDVPAKKAYALALKSANPNLYIMWGSSVGAATQYWPTYYDTFLPLMLADAQWAQDNSMDAFNVMNEMQTSSGTVGGHNGEISVSSLVRASNVTTCVTSSAHGLVAGDNINILGASPSSFNVSNADVTIVDTTTVTFSNAGVDESATGTIKLEPSYKTLVRLVKALAAAAQDVFTRGPICYSESQGYETAFTSITPNTDLDLIGLNVYGTGGGNTSFASFKSRIDTMYGIFGNQMIITEYNCNTDPWSATVVECNAGPSSRAFNDLWAKEMKRRTDYIQSVGIEQAYIYQAHSNVNSLSLYYTHSVTAPVLNGLNGGWKPVYDRLLNRRPRTLILGTTLT